MARSAVFVLRRDEQVNEVADERHYGQKGYEGEQRNGVQRPNGSLLMLHGGKCNG